MTNPIYLSSWSIRNQIKSKKLSLPELFEFAQRNNFQGVEIIDRHLESIETGYVKSLARHKKEMGIGLNLGVSNDFTLERPEALQMQINYTLNMIRLANQLDAGIVRICLGGFDNRFEKFLKIILTRKNDSTALQSIKRQKSVVSKLFGFKFFRSFHDYIRTHQQPKPLANGKILDHIFKAFDSILPLAEKYSVKMAIENHWGVSTLPENILKVINYYSSDYLGTCPDFGNFTVHQNSYEEIEKLLPYAKAVHAKSNRFLPDGEEAHIDYIRCVALMKSNQFVGPITVEYEGEGDQIEGSIKTKNLIRKYI